MKKNYYLIAALAISLASVSANSQTVIGSVGVTSNSTYRGVSISNKNPALTADVLVKLDTGPIYVFGDLNGSTANVGALKAAVNAELGVGLANKQVNVEAGGRRRMYFGSAAPTSPIIKPHDMNYNEAFVRVKAPLFMGSVYGEANKTFTRASIAKTTTNPLNDQYYVIGYTQELGPVTAYAQSAFGKTTSSKLKASNTEVGLSYQVNKQFFLGASYMFGARDVKNQVALLANYKF